MLSLTSNFWTSQLNEGFWTRWWGKGGGASWLMLTSMRKGPSVNVNITQSGGSGRQYLTPECSGRQPLDLSPIFGQDSLCSSSSIPQFCQVLASQHLICCFVSKFFISFCFSGLFATVRKCTHRESGIEYAAKFSSRWDQSQQSHSIWRGIFLSGGSQQIPLWLDNVLDCVMKLTAPPRFSTRSLSCPCVPGPTRSSTSRTSSRTSRSSSSSWNSKYLLGSFRE